MKIFNCPKFVYVVLLAASAGTLPSPAQSEIELSDSLLLFENILKDLEMGATGGEQYKMFIRAESTYKDIKKIVSDSESRKLHRKLGRAFQKLSPPEMVENESGLPLRLAIIGAKQVYISDAVPNRLFVAFLNDKGVTFDVMKALLFPDTRVIHWDNTESAFTTTQPDQTVLGMNYSAATGFAAWLSKVEHVTYLLPDIATVIHGLTRPANCWTSEPWQEKRITRQESRDMFGGNFHTLVLAGEEVGCLPEACYAGIELRVVTTIKNGKKVYLKWLKTQL